MFHFGAWQPLFYCLCYVFLVYLKRDSDEFKLKHIGKNRSKQFLQIVQPFAIEKESFSAANS